MIERLLAGTTRRFTWTNSGATATATLFNLLTGSETMVTCYSTVLDSGNGHYYKDVTMPDTPGFYAYLWQMTVNGNVYKTKGKLRVILEEVD